MIAKTHQSSDFPAVCEYCKNSKAENASFDARSIYNQNDLFFYFFAFLFDCSSAFYDDLTFSSTFEAFILLTDRLCYE